MQFSKTTLFSILALATSTMAAPAPAPEAALAPEALDKRSADVSQTEIVC